MNKWVILLIILVLLFLVWWGYGHYQQVLLDSLMEQAPKFLNPSIFGQ